MSLHITRPLSVIEDSGLAGLQSQDMRLSTVVGEIDPLRLQAARDLLLTQIPSDLLDPVAPAAKRDPEILRVLRAEIGRQIERGNGPLRDQASDDASLLRLFQETLGWGPAQPYLDDERVQEVKIVGNQILVQEEGADFVLVPERFNTTQEVLDRALLLADRLNVTLDRSHPQDTLPLGHGTRVHVTIPPCTPEGSGLVCIRRGRRRAWTIDDLLRRNACDAAVADLLSLLVRAECSFLIAGETGSGKTALLEALVNSWPGEPHVITIEDNTLEINVRHSAWTCELVQSAHEAGAFGRAAREVLRQTPSLVAPGETRAEEAGAILAVAVSGHAVITTIHARSVQRAVQRFADCAAMPGAYIYSGRRNHALEDACDNFHVIIQIEKIGGRRYIQEIALLDGTDGAEDRPRARMLSLARVEAGSDGAPTWICNAAVHNDTLVWHGSEQTPEGLQRRLERLRNRRPQRMIGTSRSSVEDALVRASQADQAEQGLRILNRAWSERRDKRLATNARRILDAHPQIAQGYEQQARAIGHRIEQHIAARRFTQASADYATIIADVALYAAHTPDGGWQAIEDYLHEADTAEQQARTRLSEARAALEQQRLHLAIELLDTVSLERLSPIQTIEVLSTRRTVLEILHSAGEIGSEALAAVDAALKRQYAASGSIIGNEEACTPQ